MHWAHANTAANNYSIGLITIAYYTKGARLIRVGTAVGRSASQIQTYSSVARPKSGNHAEPRTKQHSTTWPSPPTHQMCRERKTERERERERQLCSSQLCPRQAGGQGPSLDPAPPTLPPPCLPGEERQLRPRRSKEGRGGEDGHVELREGELAPNPDRIKRAIHTG